MSLKNIAFQIYPLSAIVQLTVHLGFEPGENP